MKVRRWARGAWRRIRPFPGVRQLDSSDCGPAALLTVLRYLGGNATISEIRMLSRTDANGSTLLGLGRAARSLLLESRGAVGTYDQLKRERMPCIAHLTLEDGRRHFVVIRRIRRRGVRISDPAGELGHLTRARFEQLWRSRAVLLLSAVEGRPVRRSPERPWYLWVAAYGTDEPGWLAQSLFLGVLSTGIGLVTALFVRTLIDDLIPRGELGLAAMTGVLLLVVLGVKAAASHARTRFLIHLSRSASSRATHDVLRNLFHQPAAFFQGRALGELTARVRDGVRVHRGLVETVSVFVMDGLVLAGSIGLLFVLAPELAPIPFVVLPLHAVMVHRRAGRVHDGHVRTLTALGDAEGDLTDCLRGVFDIRCFLRGDTFARRVGRRFDVTLDHVEALEITESGLGFVSELSGSLLVVGSLTIGALHVIGGDLLIGELMAGYSLLTGTVGSANRIARASVRLEEIEVAAERARDLIRRRRPAVEADPGRIGRGLRLEIVPGQGSLGGAGGGRSFDFPTNEVVCVSGPSGAGKTTLLRLLAGDLCAPWATLHVDGRALGDPSVTTYRDRVAVFRSGTHLFRGTLEFNVLLDRSPGAGTERLAELADAGFGDFLERFPKRWASRIGERGRILSTGEAQVIGLMRALVGRPDILLVDEGLAGVDEELRDTMLDAILEFGRGRVLVLVSHDPAVLAAADRTVSLPSPSHSWYGWRDDHHAARRLSERGPALC